MLRAALGTAAAGHSACQSLIRDSDSGLPLWYRHHFRWGPVQCAKLRTQVILSMPAVMPPSKPPSLPASVTKSMLLSSTLSAWMLEGLKDRSLTEIGIVKTAPTATVSDPAL